MESYLVHDNGGRPFKVVIDYDNSFLKAYKLIVISNETNMITKLMPIVELSTEGKVISKEYIEYKYDPDAENNYDTLVYQTSFENVFTDNGSSILVNISRNNYVYIGVEIFSFESFGEITNFVSPIGNSDVVYSSASDDKYTYLFADNVFVETKYLDLDSNDPLSVYDIFYSSKIKKFKRFDINLIHERNY